MNRAYN